MKTRQRAEEAQERAVETWVQIPGLDLYEASSEGRIRSWAVPGYLGYRAKQPRILRADVLESGHLRVCLGRSRRESVHVLVATAFHGARPLGYECRHLDGRPANNRPENLRWGTHSENMRDRDRHGTTPRGTSHHAAKLNDGNVREIRRSTATISDLARRFGVARRSIRLIRQRKTWTHVAD